MKDRMPASHKRRASRETLLLILLPCLSLVLAGFLLLPAVKGYKLRYETRRSELQAAELTPEPIRLRPVQTSAPVVYETGDPFFGWQREGDSLYYLAYDGSRLTGLHRIDGRLYYFLPDGRKTEALGVDVSFYNEDVDWDAVYAQGVDFAIIRVGGRGWGSGQLYGDIRTAQYLHNAREAGLKIGVYFYSTAGSEREAAEEARATLRAIGGIALDLPVFIDVEESGEYPDGRADKLSKAERSVVIETFCRIIEAAGYEAGVYSGEYYFREAVRQETLKGRTLWIANYTASSRNQLPALNVPYRLWQFTDRGMLKGIRGPADLNIIF